MRVRAAIFDIYRTVLEVGPPPADAATRWRWLWESTFGGRPRLDLETFLAGCEAVVRRDHGMARARGIGHPEVYWPGVIADVLPELESVSERARQAFEVALARLQHTTGLMPGAAPVLRLLLNSGVVLGIASNAQPYTLHELNEALTAVGLGVNVFQSDLTFWSFQHGFSKPDPHVFQLLNARLRARGIETSETVMVGDRLDNDVQPARQCGWATFLLNPGASPGPEGSGDWQRMAHWLDGRLGG